MSPVCRRHRLANSQRASAPRRGYSLLEMLVVISVMSIILGGVVVMLHSMYRADQAARRELESSVNLDRLAVRFRTDAHSATSADVKDSAVVLKLAGERSVEYRFNLGRVERTVQKGDVIEHHDSFRLSNDASVSWKVEPDAPTFVTGLVERTEGKPIRIEARMGTDHRFEEQKQP